MKALELLLTLVFVGAAGVALVGGIVVLLSVYVHVRTRAADDLSARWYSRRPRTVRRQRPIDVYFAQQARTVRAFNEQFFQTGKRLVPVVALAVVVAVLTGLMIDWLA